MLQKFFWNGKHRTSKATHVMLARTWICIHSDRSAVESQSAPMHICKYLGSNKVDLANMPLISLPAADTPTSKLITADYGISDSTAEQWHTRSPSPIPEDPNSPLSSLH